jgi:hypothetical protein
VPLDRDGRAVDAKVTTGKKREEPRPSEVEGRGACTVTPNDLAPSRKILHRTTKRIKFHTAVIINSELSNRDKILNKVRGKKNIIKMKIMREVSCAGGGDRYTATVTDNNARRRTARGRCGRRKSTDIGGDMVGGTSVEIPFVLGGC